MSKKKKILDQITSIFFITIGCVIAAFAIGSILIPNKILDGGINGVSIILGLKTFIPTSVYIVLLNIPFLLLGYKTLGKEFVFKALYAMILFAIILYFMEMYNFGIDDMLLATVYGGVILGLGVGLIIRYGGCLDGTEIAAIILSKKTNFSLGQIVLICNVVIFGVAGFVFGIDRALYSLLTYFITSKIIDYISEGLEKGKAAMIITNQSAKVAKDIYEKLGRTVTSFEGKGMINGETMILYCVITRLELNELKKIVSADDVQAFVTIMDVSDIIGTHIKKGPKNVIEEKK